jgi:hypothetical protein
MKTVTVQEFYRNRGLVNGLAEGQKLVVTANLAQGAAAIAVLPMTRLKQTHGQRDFMHERGSL